MIRAAFLLCVRLLILAVSTGWLLPLSARAQQKQVGITILDSSEPGYRTVIPGIEYRRPSFYQFLWGNQYRKEWTTAVRVPVLVIDSFDGGLTPIKQGGGRQSLSLQLQNRQGKQYVLRSINKDYSEALPPITEGTFLQDLAKDQVSTIHPFSALTVQPMISAAGIYHTNPRIVFIKPSPALGSFNSAFGNGLFLLEERPDEDGSTSPNFGWPRNMIGTQKLFEELNESNDDAVDQRRMVRARLFDMFIGDWGRHDDQWRWAEQDSGKGKFYQPIPRDRDQIYSRFNGFLLNRITGIEALEHLQTFSGRIKNIKKFNFPARNLDRRLTNEMTKEVWVEEARILQRLLTDTLIDESIRRLPPELFPISGPRLAQSLKQRRDDLQGYAEKYAGFINEEVDIPGSMERELFKVIRKGDSGTTVEVFAIDAEDQPAVLPFYRRHFNTKETDELRLYGIGGNDRFEVEGEGNDIKVHLIGGPQEDVFINSSSSRKKLVLYDNPGNTITGSFHQQLSRDSVVHVYDYGSFKYNAGSKILRPFYSNVRGLHLQFGYDYTKQIFRKEPFGWYQGLFGYYSVSNRSFGLDYAATFTELIGKWNLVINGNYDAKLDQLYFGVGNNTKFVEEKPFYRYFNKEWGGSVGVNRIFARKHLLGLTGGYSTYAVLPQKDNLIDQQLPFNDPDIFDRKQFASLRGEYLYRNYNNEVIPTKGFLFSLQGGHTWNLPYRDRSFFRADAIAGVYLPLSQRLSLAIRAGGGAVSGNPEFYQLPWIGGGATLRGYFRQRFMGKTVAYNTNDLRWIFPVKTYLFNGHMGLIGFFDEGRVWMPGEKSDQWHTGWGGGVLLAPFNKVSLTVYYGVSEETSRFHIRLGRLF